MEPHSFLVLQNTERRKSIFADLLADEVLANNSDSDTDFSIRSVRTPLATYFDSSAHSDSETILKQPEEFPETNE